MHELPSQTLLQQAKARPVSGEELEVFGKHASSLYLRGDCSTLNEAVVETVKRAGLSPEQVKRVVEFANTSAYLSEFQKEGSPHKYIEFHGGPANPSEVLKDLNDGGGGTVFDRGMGDYRQAPEDMKKSAHVLFERNLSALGLEKSASEDAVAHAFQAEDRELPYAEPWHDAVAMRDKLAAAADALTAELNTSEVSFWAMTEDLYHQVKQAALNDTSLGEVVQAWAEVVPGPNYVKLAFARIGPRLVEEGVFSYDALGASLEKTAGATAMVNTDHPLIRNFAAFCLQLDKLAHVRRARDETALELERLNWFIKKASIKTAATKTADRAMELARAGGGAIQRLVGEGGLVPKAWGGAKQLALSASKPASQLGAAIGGPTVGKAVGKAVEYSPHIAAGLGGKELYDRYVKYGPGQLPLRYAKSHLPGTREYYIRQMNLQQGMMPM